MIEELDTLISVVDLKKFFTFDRATQSIHIFANACPTTSLMTETPSYQHGRFCIVVDKLVHVRLSDIWDRSEEMLAAKNANINKEFWVDAQAFVRHELTENYRVWRLSNGI